MQFIEVEGRQSETKVYTILISRYIVLANSNCMTFIHLHNCHGECLSLISQEGRSMKARDSVIVPNLF